MRKLISNQPLRRAIAGACMVIGALLMWLAPNAVVVGIALLVAGLLLEVTGIALERRDGD